MCKDSFPTCPSMCVVLARAVRADNLQGMTLLAACCWQSC